MKAPLTLAAMVAGVALWTARRKTEPSADSRAPQRVAARRRVLNRDRLGGVDPRLLELLSLWEAHGSHDVEIAPLGGRRSAGDQARLYADGASEAAQLTDSAHGYGLAIDVWPVGFDAYAWTATWERVPSELKAQFEAFGEFAEAAGLEWGGRWRTSRLPNGDQPHVQIPHWRAEVTGRV